MPRVGPACKLQSIAGSRKTKVTETTWPPHNDLVEEPYHAVVSTTLHHFFRSWYRWYTHGVRRIAQVNTGTEYFLGDGFGTVRQLTNGSGSVN
jgi:hypothetical protein